MDDQVIRYDAPSLTAVNVTCGRGACGVFAGVVATGFGCGVVATTGGVAAGSVLPEEPDEREGAGVAFPLDVAKVYGL